MGGGGIQGVMAVINNQIKDQIENSPAKQQERMLAAEKKRVDQENAVNTASEQQRLARAKQKSFASSAQAKGGTVLTSPLGVTNAVSTPGIQTGFTGGGKTLLGS